MPRVFLFQHQCLPQAAIIACGSPDRWRTGQAHVEIPAFIEKLTGITNELAQTGMPDQQAAEDFFLHKLPQLVRQRWPEPAGGQPKVARVWVGHNIEHYDYPLIYCWGQRHGIDVHTELLKAGFIGTIDTLKLCRLLDWPGGPPRDEIDRVSYGLGACFAHEACAGRRMGAKHRSKPDAEANCVLVEAKSRLLLDYILQNRNHVVILLAQSTVRARTLKYVYDNKKPAQLLEVRITAAIEAIAARAAPGSDWDLPADWGQIEAQDAKVRQLCHSAAQAVGATTGSVGEGRARYVRVTFPTV